MYKNNNRKRNLILSSLIISILTLSFVNHQAPWPEYNFGDFTKKKYYKELFTKKEINKLKNASEKISEAQEDIKKAKDYFEKVRVFNSIKKNSRTEKEKKRATKKAEKYLKKALNYGLGAHNDIFKAQKTIFNIYDSRLRKFKIDKSKYHKFAKKYKNSGHKKYTEFLVEKRKGDNSKGKEKYDKYEKASETATTAIKYQELALGLFMKDKKIDLSKLKKEKNNKTKDDKNKKDTTKTDTTKKDTVKEKTNKDTIPIDSTQTATYNPDNDPNVYHSFADSLLPLLEISEKDAALIKKAAAKERIAKKHMDAVEFRYKKIDAVLSLILKEKDKVKKEMLKQDAAVLEKDVFVDLLKAADLYKEANSIKYNVYKKYFSKLRTNNNADKLSRGKKFEENATELNLMATSAVANANLQMYVSEEYLQMMNAVQIQLSAIQQQENAYAVYLGWPITPLKKTFKNRYYGKNEVVTTETNDNNGKTNDNNGKTNNNKGNNVTNNKVSKNTSKKYTYNYSGSYAYSSANPKPKQLSNVSGTVFRIQVGVFKRLLSLKTFGEFSPITYDEFHNNPFKRFMVGEYRSREAAEYALNIIKKKGINDAFIIAYKNGKRQNYKKATATLNKDNDYKKIAEQEVSHLRETDKNTNKKNTLSYPDFISYGTGEYDFAQGEDISKTKGLVYIIQIGFYKMPKTNQELKHISPLYQEVNSGGIKYLTGKSGTYKDAKIKRANVRKLGFDKAFVTAYHNGQSITLTKAKEIQKSNSGTPVNNEKQPNVYFSVQIGAYSSLLPPEKEAEFNQIAKQYTISAKNGPNGLIIYTVGQFLTYKEAKEFSLKLKPSYPDVFVVAFAKERKIPVSEAIKLTEQ